MNLTQSAITTVITTTNALGTFAGQRLPNLQINRLEPGEYTIQFSLVEPVIDGLASATYAYVDWKVDGQQLQRIVSVYSGAAISGVAEAVDIHLLDQSNRGVNKLVGVLNVVNGSFTVTTSAPVTLAANEIIYFSSQSTVGYSLAAGVSNATTFSVYQIDPVTKQKLPYTGPNGINVDGVCIATYKVGVTLSKGTRPTTMQPPVLYTVPTVEVTSSSVSPVTIPTDAGIISVLITAIVEGFNPQAEAANGVAEFADPSSNLLGSYIVNGFPMWYPVPPGSTSLVLLNNSTTKTLEFSVQWGIEG